jgi:hypothetical protein
VLVRLRLLVGLTGAAFSGLFSAGVEVFHFEGAFAVLGVGAAVETAAARVVGEAAEGVQVVAFDLLDFESDWVGKLVRYLM